MKRYSNLLMLACGLLLFHGCRKTDFRFADPARHCRVDEISGLLGEQVIHRKFSYNQFGNPVSAIYVETEDGTGTPSFYFYYNEKHQLIRYTGYSSHRLTYNAIGQVIIDSASYYYTGGDARYEDKYSYDFYGRISRIVSRFYYDVYGSAEVGTVTTNYLKYDGRGNLIIPGVSYDHKVNVSRTHPVWMFINKNYSQNNAVKATSYNQAKLPLTFNESINFLESSIVIQSIAYSCDDSVNKK